MRKRSMPLGGAAHEIFDHIVGIVGVADAIRAAQQHLRQKVGRAFAHEGEALPRILGEKAHRDVEGGAAPAFEREQLRQALGVGFGRGDDVARAHARRDQRLMRVAHGGVGDEHALLGAHPFGELSGAELFEALARPIRNGLVRIIGRDRRARGRRRPGAAARFRMAVDGDVGDPGQELGRAVLALLEVEQRRRLVDEARRIVVGDEMRMR